MKNTLIPINLILILLIATINVMEHEPRWVDRTKSAIKRIGRNTHMKKYKRLVRLAIAHTAVACVLVAAYSPGCLALRPSDPSILRAGMSILTIPACLLVLALVDWPLIRKPKPVYVKPNDTLNAAQVRNTLKSCTAGNNTTPYLIKHIEVLEDQLERIQQSRERTLTTIQARFEPGSYTFERYESIITEAYLRMLKTITVIANNLSVYDENKYVKLKKEYKYDDIPDDIQEERLDLYEKMRERIEKGIATGERIIVRMDKLTMELLSDESEIQSSDQLVQQIEELTVQLKYYE